MSDEPRAGDVHLIDGEHHLVSGPREYTVQTITIRAGQPQMCAWERGDFASGAASFNLFDLLSGAPDAWVEALRFAPELGYVPFLAQQLQDLIELREADRAALESEGAEAGQA